MNRSSHKTSRFTYANVASTAAILALVAGTGGVAYAAGVAKNSVGSPQIIDGSVKGKDLGPGAVSSAKVKDGSLDGLDMNPATYMAFIEGPDSAYSMIDNELVDEFSTLVKEIDVPMGDVFVSVTGTLTNAGNNQRVFRCELTQPVGSEFTRTVATFDETVPATSTTNFALSGIVVKHGGASELTMTCDGLVAPFSAAVDAQVSTIMLGSSDEM